MQRIHWHLSYRTRTVDSYLVLKKTLHNEVPAMLAVMQLTLCCVDLVAMSELS